MNTNKMHIISVPMWEKYTWLRHGFSSRSGGLSTVYGGRDLNLGYTKDDDPELVAGNRRLFLDAVGGDAAGEMVTVRQVHGTAVQVVDAGHAAELRTSDGRAVVEADGLMTVVPGIMLAIQVADCVPVLVADVRQRVVRLSLRPGQTISQARSGRR
jgi:polyphenol oxidase